MTSSVKGPAAVSDLLGLHFSSNYAFERTMPLVFAAEDRYYLQATQKDFQDMLLPGSNEQRKALVEPPSGELIEIAKLALEKGELEIAENFLAKAVRKQKLENLPSGKNWEPCFYLAEVLEKRAIKDGVQLLHGQRLLLQAAALYNFVKNCMKVVDVEGELVVKTMEMVTRKLLDIRHSLVSMSGGNPLRCQFDSENERKRLELIRKGVKDWLESTESRTKVGHQRDSSEELGRGVFVKQASDIRNLCRSISTKVKEFFAGIIHECIEVLGKAPCDYEILVLGSLAREEMTPYSDLEWAILTSSEDEHCKVFFRNMTNLVHLQIINLGETILPSMGIDALSSANWFFDEVTPRGLSFDGFLPQACKTPFGNIEDFELIHSPARMAKFHNDYWYEKNSSLGEILLTVCPLEADKHALIDEYRTEREQVLAHPCDSKKCRHDGAEGKYPSRGSCRSRSTLRKDVARYGVTMTGRNELDDGRLYDVKKEVYRLTDRVVAGLGKSFRAGGNGAFDVLDELQKKGVITCEASENLSSAVAIALKLRLTTYLRAGRQGEQIKATGEVGSNSTAMTPIYHLPSEKELFHFFYVAIPLYEELGRFCGQQDCLQVSLSQNAFFDCSDGVKGDIYCRVLDYPKAAQCYARTVEADPENIGLFIRRIKVDFMTNAEALSTARDKLDVIVQRIGENCGVGGETSSVTHACGVRLPNNRSTCTLVTDEDMRVLLEMLLFISDIYLSRNDQDSARRILTQCLQMEKSRGVDEMQVLMMKFSLLNSGMESLAGGQLEEKAITAKLMSLIDEEGISARSMVLLNTLGEFLCIRKQHAPAYECFHRVFALERALFGGNVNFNVLTTLYGLGLVSTNLFLYDESRFYLEQVVRLGESLNGPRPRLLTKQAYWQLSLVFWLTHHYEDALRHLQKGLAVTTGHRSGTEVNLDCAMHCQMSASWHELHDKEKAWKSARDARECLGYCVGLHAKFWMTQLVVYALGTIERNEEAVLLLEEGLRELDSDSEPGYAVQYLKSLGSAYARERLTSEAERCYEKALSLLKVNENPSDVVECLLGVCDVLYETNRSPNARSKLREATALACSLTSESHWCSKIMKEIAVRWEKLGVISDARDCYERALALCGDSTALKRDVFFEFDLHVRLGDLMTNAIDRGKIPPVSSEMQQGARRIHYDRAGDVLRQGCARAGYFNSTNIVMCRCLASKYASIDPTEQERLLLEALKMSRAVYGSNKPSEMVSAMVWGLAAFYGSTMNEAAALEFLQSSLEMEMELHPSEPHHEHISRQMPVLCGLFTIHTRHEKLREVTQRLLRFMELGLAKDPVDSDVSVPKANAAYCFSMMGYLYILLGDFEKAETFSQIAAKINYSGYNASTRKSFDLMKESLDELKQVPGSQMMSLQIRESICQPLLLQILWESQPEFRQCLEGMVSLTVQPSESSSSELSCREPNSQEQKSRELTSMELSSQELNSPGRNSQELSLRVPNSPELNSQELSTMGLSFRELNQQELNTQELHSQEQNVRELSSQNRNSAELSSQILTSQDKDGYKQSQDLDTVESLKDSLLMTLVDAMTNDINKGDIDKATHTMENSVKPLICSMFEGFEAEMVEQSINDAAAALLKFDTSVALASLDTAELFPSDSRRKVTMMKLRGKCHLYKTDYRLAALTFTKAARHISESTSPERDFSLEYSEILIGLTKSHVLCNDVPSALCVIQDGIKALSFLESGEMKSRLIAEFFYLGARCLLHPMAEVQIAHKNLEQAVSYCQQALNASQDVNKLRGPCYLTEELVDFARVELFALKCDIQLLLAGVLLALDRSHEARNTLKDLIEFLGNVAVVIETYSKDTWPRSGVDFLRIHHLLFSWIGQASVMCGDVNGAMASLTKSMTSFIASALPNVLPSIEELAALVDAITVAKSTEARSEKIPFQEAIKFFKQAFIAQRHDLEVFRRFLVNLGDFYACRSRMQEAIAVYEIARSVTECMTSSNEGRAKEERMLMRLGNAHRLLAMKKKGWEADEERDMAERCYLDARRSSEGFPVITGVCYANFLLEQKRLTDARETIERVIEAGDEIWDTNNTNMIIFCPYSSRCLYGPAVEKYVCDHGELMTTAGNLAYYTLVRVLGELGLRAEALAARKTMASKGKDLIDVLSGKQPSLIPCLLADCPKPLISAQDAHNGQLLDSNPHLSADNSTRVYDNLKHESKEED